MIDSFTLPHINSATCKNNFHNHPCPVFINTTCVSSLSYYNNYLKWSTYQEKMFILGISWSFGPVMRWNIIAEMCGKGRLLTS